MPRFKRSSCSSEGGGFTLVELLVALIVSSVVLTAVATLAYAMSAANDATDDTSRKQAQVRYATMRVSDLVRHCKLICFSGPDDFAVWRGDDNEDDRINGSELVYVEKGAGDRLRICDFPASGSDPVVDLSEIRAYSTNWWAGFGMAERETAVIRQCSNVQFSFDVLPPRTRFVSITFGLVENDISRQYQINAYVRGWAGNLLNDTDDGFVSDDD